MTNNLPPILPVGTAVVTRVGVAGAITVRPKGTAGTIIFAPGDAEHAYRIRFPDGDETMLRRTEFQVLSLHQDESIGLVSPLAEFDLEQHVIYRCVIGSRAYGLDHAASDTDRRGIYIAPASLHWSLYRPPEQLENDATQECYWEIEKYIRLALKGNPNVLETLYSPLVDHLDSLAEPLLAHRDLFLSKLVFQTFNGYAMSQFRKMEQDLRARGEVKWKHAMHLIRLLRSGIDLLKNETLTLDVGASRDDLLSIRNGQRTWDQVNRERLSLHAEFESAYQTTRLPERPDYVQANELLVAARKTMAGRERESHA